MEKKKLITLVILSATVLLSLVAAFMALKLYQIGKKPAATPAAKVTKKDTGQTPEVFQQDYPCQLAFTVTTSSSPSVSPSIPPSTSPGASPSVSPSVSPSLSPSASPSPSVSPSPPESSPSPSTPSGCWDYCTYDNQCPSNLRCLPVNGVSRCVNPNCTTSSNCICSVTPANLSPSPSLVAFQPATQLPSAGTSLPTLLLGVGGALLIVLGLLL